MNVELQFDFCLLTCSLSPTLGIFYWLYTLLEEASHELDVKAEFQDSWAGARYDLYVSADSRMH